MSFIVLIDYPKSQAYVVDALRRAFGEVMPFAKIITSHSGEKVNLQWSDYDELKWDLPTQFSCYVIRKA